MTSQQPKPVCYIVTSFVFCGATIALAVVGLTKPFMSLGDAYVYKYTPSLQDMHSDLKDGYTDEYYSRVTATFAGVVMTFIFTAMNIANTLMVLCFSFNSMRHLAVIVPMLTMISGIITASASGALYASLSDAADSVPGTSPGPYTGFLCLEFLLVLAVIYSCVGCCCIQQFQRSHSPPQVHMQGAGYNIPPQVHVQGANYQTLPETDCLV